jgi:hypothetical protein
MRADFMRNPAAGYTFEECTVALKAETFEMDRG